MKINADNLPRFMACNGSRLLEASAPPMIDDTSARDEGTAAHYMATAVFNSVHSLDELVDRKAPNGVFMTAEMAEHVQAYLAILPPPLHLYSFSSMELDTSRQTDHWLVPARVDFAGLYKDNASILRVVDFKYGWRIVEPEKNWTLIFHAISFCLWKQVTPERIDIQIFQPRPRHPDGPLRTWSIDYDQLVALYAQLSDALRNPSDETRTSNHCGKCRALAICGTARLAEMNSVDTADMAFSDTIDNVTLSQALDNLNRAGAMIEARKEAFEELAKQRLRAGQIIDNYSVTMGEGNRTWTAGLNADMLRAITGVDLSTPKMVTPKEAERRGVSETIVKSLSYRPPTGLKLSRVKASKRAEKIFGPATKG